MIKNNLKSPGLMLLLLTQISEKHHCGQTI